MARRLKAPLQNEPVATPAALARHLAIFAAIATLFSIVIVRFGIFEPRPAIATFLGALAFAGLSILVALLGFVSIWRHGTRGFGHIALAILIAVLILIYPAYLTTKFRSLPPIHDITTDPIDPPKFETLARLRGVGGANPAAYAGLYSAEQQQKAYPNVEPILADATPAQAYDVVMALIVKRKWSVVDARKPQPPRNVGHIEAVARTAIMGFRDDVAIRIKPDGGGAKIDMRSSSRYFTHDLGTNASRLIAFIEEANERIEALRPEPGAEPKKPAAPNKRAPKR
jgi:uncharacterized protein (DUF1499 family)/uncharacterized membrane protein